MKNISDQRKAAQLTTEQLKKSLSDLIAGLWLKPLTELIKNNNLGVI